MERKIGEIFKHGDEWYQCVESSGCALCAFNETDCNDIDTGSCEVNSRSDGKSVVFRELEKAGEPYNIGKKVFQRYEVLVKPYIFNDEFFTINTPVEDSYISIEIKQNKEEDMKTVRISKDDLNFLVNKIRYGILPKHTDCDAIIAEITDLFSVEDVNLSNSENIGKNLKPFDLEAAKSGKPVCTRSGKPVRIICFDVKSEMPIVALVESCNNIEVPIAYYNDGCIYADEYNDDDLMMLPEKKEGWVNVYKRENEYICENECNVSTGIAVYKSEGEAKRNIDKTKNYVNTIKINWEE